MSIASAVLAPYTALDSVSTSRGIYTSIKPRITNLYIKFSTYISINSVPTENFKITPKHTPVLGPTPASEAAAAENWLEYQYQYQKYSRDITTNTNFISSIKNIP